MSDHFWSARSAGILPAVRGHPARNIRSTESSGSDPRDYRGAGAQSQTSSFPAKWQWRYTLQREADEEGKNFRVDDKPFKRVPALLERTHRRGNQNGFFAGIGRTVQP